MRLADRWKVAAEEAMSPEEFKKLLEGQLKPNGRFIAVSVAKPLANEQLVFVTLINLPEELGKKRDVEGMNNRLQISIDLTRPKVKAEQMSSQLPREFKLRGKSGTPAQIAKHVADFLNKVVQEVPPKYTHTKVASKAVVNPWKVTAASSMKADSWYHQEAGKGRDLWFLAKSQQKNEGWAGVEVEWQKKNPSSKKSSVPKAFIRLWEELPESEVPSEVKEAVK